MIDLIDRDAVLHDVSTECSNAHEAKYYEAQVALTRAKRIICDAPAVNRWIPCSERLPENFNYVIAAGSDGIGIVRYNGTLFADDSGAIYPISAFTHWMPLPEPPKEVEKR